MSLLVVKVGGSLYDLSDLGTRLKSFLRSLEPSVPLLVPGGGLSTDAVRAFDRTHGIGPGAAHWLALRACTVNAHFLGHLLGFPVVSHPREADGPSILDAFAFAEWDEANADHLPHRWEATSDSVAARVAEVANVGLILLKSITVPNDDDWDAASRAGHVDAIFPTIVRRTKLNVEMVNLRDEPD